MAITPNIYNDHDDIEWLHSSFFDADWCDDYYGDDDDCDEEDD